jgi:cell division septation protein DedD
MTGIEDNDHKELHLDHRHLTFFFIGAVVICAIFFALGFIVGRGQAFEASIKVQSIVTETLPSKSGLEAPSEPGQKTGPSVDDSTVEPKQLATLDSAGVKPNDAVADYRKELDFYSAVKDQKVKENFNPAPEKVKDSTKPAATQSARSPARSLSLQVAALTNMHDVDTLAAALRSKGYRVFVVRPEPGLPDKFIRIQVGPFKTTAEAAGVKARLEREGYKPIFKR